MLFAGTFFGMSSSEAASFAALALVVGFREREGGFFEAGLVLGGGGIVNSRFIKCSNLKMACYWKCNITGRITKMEFEIDVRGGGEWIVHE